ncbi:hypothetical protein ABBQ32_006487 [Trebouxia sp. C0010 RCD-2024]
MAFKASLLAKAHMYQHRAQPQPLQQAPSKSPRQRRRQQQKVRAKKAAEQPSGQQQSLHTTFCPAMSLDGDLVSQGRVALTRPLDPVADLGASAMLLWAEDVDIPLDTARQAVQHVHAQHMSLVTQHGTASHVALPEPLQSLMVEAIRAVTGDASFTPLTGTNQPLSPEPPPLASESAPRRSSRARHPVTPYWTVHPAAPGGAQ